MCRMLADFRLRRSITDEKEGGDMPIELNHMPTDQTMPWPVLSAPCPAGREEGGREGGRELSSLYLSEREDGAPVLGCFGRLS